MFIFDEQQTKIDEENKNICQFCNFKKCTHREIIRLIIRYAYMQFSKEMQANKMFIYRFILHKAHCTQAFFQLIIQFINQTDTIKGKSISKIGSFKNK